VGCGRLAGGTYTRGLPATIAATARPSSAPRQWPAAVWCA